MWLSSLKALPLLEDSPPTNTKYPKYENIREKYENGDECATLKITQIGCPKLGILACSSSGDIMTWWGLKPKLRRFQNDRQ